MALLSGASLVAGYLLVLLLHDALGVPASIAFGISVALLSVANFFGCRHFVFSGKPGPMLQEAIRFFPSILLFRVVEVAVFAFLMARLGNHHIAYVVTVGFSACIKLLVSRWFIFRRA